MSWRKLASAMLMGAAIPVMHYTGMAAASFRSTTLPVDLTHSVAKISSIGVVGIGGVAFMTLSLGDIDITRRPSIFSAVAGTSPK